MGKLYSQLVFISFIIALAVPSFGLDNNIYNQWDNLLKGEDREAVFIFYPALLFELVERTNDARGLKFRNEQFIKWAEKTYESETIVRAYTIIFRYTPQNHLHDGCQEKIDRLIDILSTKMDNDSARLEAYHSISHAAISSGYYEPEHIAISKKYALEMINLAIEMGDEEKEVRGNILLGKANVIEDNIIDAYRYLLRATKSIQTNNKELKGTMVHYDLWGELYFFYKKIKDWDEAVAYKKRQIDEVLNASPIDSLALSWLKYDLYKISQLSGRYLHSDEDYIALLKYAQRNDLERLKQWGLAMYRGYLINQSKFENLKRLYEEDFPGELEQIEKQRPILYCMIKGYMCEVRDQKDSAFVHFNRATEILEKGEEANLAATQYLSLGEIYNRYGNVDSAFIMFERGLAFSEEAQNKELSLSALNALLEICKEKADYKRALVYSEKRSELNQKMFDASGKTEVLRMSFTAEEDLEDIRAEQVYKHKKKVHNRQNWGIAAGLVILFLIMIMMSRMAVSEWVIEMMAFFTVLFIFEFFILSLDHELHYATDGAPLPMFLAKVALLSFLFPLHHVIEKGVLSYMRRQKLIKDPTKSIPQTIKRKVFKGLATLWPWLSSDDKAEH